MNNTGIYSDESNRKQLQKIEDLILKVVTDVANGISPMFVLRDWKQWSNSDFTDRLVLKPIGVASNKEIRFSQVRSRSTFCILVHIMAKVYKLLKSNSYSTRRELYYEDAALMKRQNVVDSAVEAVCCLLNAAPWKLGLMATSKGLVAGPLLIQTPTGHVIDCSSPEGTIIPSSVCSDQLQLKSTAKYTLVVEKDAVFQKLLDRKILLKLPDAIVLTGKGFPDINTRILVRKLNMQLKLPVLALVDCDPHGVAIMCVYRFGSLRRTFCGDVFVMNQNMCNYGESLATPQLKWLGVHPEDLADVSRDDTIPLSESEVQMLKILINRQFIIANPRLLKQVQLMLQLSKKAEIEAISNFSTEYLLEFYIPNKIANDRLY